MDPEDSEPQKKNLPTIAIVGRPNVGKSTLFNRLVGKRYAVVADEAGTTRDRVSQKFQCNDYQVLLVDTGGLEVGNHENIEEDIQTQAKLAIQDADLILFTVDASEELTVNDFAAAEILRRSKKTTILVANKCDNIKIEQDSYNLYELGFDEPIQISAIHKSGVEILTSKINKALKKMSFVPFEEPIKDESVTNISIIGKPNAGKSSLVNSLVGHHKIIVSDIAGTTRDATDTEITFKEQKYNLIDTAGLRRRGKIVPGIEKFSSMRCIQAVDRSDIVVLLIDGNEGITSQDSHIVEHVLEYKKGLIIAINKIDLLESGEEERNFLIAKLRRKFSFVPWAPVVFISAKNSKNIHQILDLANEIKLERHKRVSTAEFNSFMQKITQKHLPASRSVKKPKFMYGSQVDINPPKFALFFKNSANLHFSCPRYLENEIRKEYGYNGTTIELSIKHSETPRTGKK